MPQEQTGPQQAAIAAARVRLEELQEGGAELEDLLEAALRLADLEQLPHPHAQA